MLQQQALHACAIMFTYPPAFALAMVPFSFLSNGMWNVAWYIVTLGATIISYRLAEALALRLVPGPWPERELIFLRVGSLLLSLKFILVVYENQAYDLVVLPLILSGLLCLIDKRNLAAAVLLAVAAALKATPILFLPYLLLRRRFAAAAAFMAVLAGVSFLPDLFFTPQGSSSGYFMTWFNNIASGALIEDPAKAKNAFWAGPNAHNHSIHGSIARLVDGTSFQADFPLILHAAQLLFVVLIGLLLVLSIRREDTIPAEGSLVIIAMLMLSPMTSRSHYVNLLLPYTVLMAYWLRDQRTKTFGTVVLGISFLLATATSNDLVGRAFSEWAFRTSHIEIGTLILIAYLAVVVWPREGVNSVSDVRKPSAAEARDSRGGTAP